MCYRFKMFSFSGSQDENLFALFSPAGVLTQGGGVFGTFVSSFYLQFSPDGRSWSTYKELVTDSRPRAKVRLTSRVFRLEDKRSILGF